MRIGNRSGMDSLIMNGGCDPDHNLDEHRNHGALEACLTEEGATGLAKPEHHEPLEGYRHQRESDPVTRFQLPA